MKKIVLIVAFVFATGSIINATSSNKEYIKITSEYIEISELPSCAGDCVQDAKYWALEMSEDHDDRGAGGELMENYNMLYRACYDANC